MSYSGPLRIFEHDGYAVDSWGNGAAYTLADLTGFATWPQGQPCPLSDDECRSAFLQGDDASDWRDEFDLADALDDPVTAMAAKVELIERYLD